MARFEILKTVHQRSEKRRTHASVGARKHRGLRPDDRRLPTTPERSALMGRVRQRGTAPELDLRALVKARAHPFETNGTNLPGSPDLYDVSRRLAVFVHGCFWHRHKRCAACTTPSRNADFWRKKFEQNVARDRRNVRRLHRDGWHVMIVWECQLRIPAKRARLVARLDRFFGTGT